VKNRCVTITAVLITVIAAILFSSNTGNAEAGRSVTTAAMRETVTVQKAVSHLERQEHTGRKAGDVKAAGNRVSARLELLRRKYPQNHYWNHPITEENIGKTVEGTWDETWCDIVTQHPCSHSFNKIGLYGCNAFDHGIACEGFANRIFYEVFGLRASSMERRYDVDNISVGDLVRFNYTHSAIVLSCGGNKVTLLECNYKYADCVIQWDRTDLVSEIIWFQHADNWDQVANGKYEGVGAKSGACGASLTWSIDKGVLSINGTGKMYGYSSAVGPGWESRKSAINSVVIGPGVTSIGAFAFYNCPNLLSVKMAGTVTEIEGHAFANCDRLTDVYYNGDKATADTISISNHNSSLTDAVWHFAVGTVPPDDPGLKVITLPNNLLTIEEEAFANTHAQKIIVPSRVTSIKSHAFLNCSNLLYLELLNGNTSIADNALEGCGSVTIICPGNSLVENWAKKKGYPVIRR